MYLLSRIGIFNMITNHSPKSYLPTPQGNNEICTFNYILSNSYFVWLTSCFKLATHSREMGSRGALCIEPAVCCGDNSKNSADSRSTRKATRSSVPEGCVATWLHRGGGMRWVGAGSGVLLGLVSSCFRRSFSLHTLCFSLRSLSFWGLKYWWKC